jgi:hypothetical protein
MRIKSIITNFVISGLMPLKQVSESGLQITPFPPGHVEAYSLDLSGRATYINTTRFHKIAECPAYKTLVNPAGA